MFDRIKMKHRYMYETTYTCSGTQTLGTIDLMIVFEKFVGDSFITDRRSGGGLVKDSLPITISRVAYMYIIF